MVGVLFAGLAGATSAQPEHLATGDRLARLTADLNLTAAQAASVERALGDDRAPGDLWALAAELTPTLTEPQKQALFARPERPEWPRSSDGASRERPEPSERIRGERPERERRERAGSERPARPEDDREAYFEAARQARNAALGLSAGQVEQLDALHEQYRAQRAERRAERPDTPRERGERPEGARRPEPGQRSPEIADLLTDEQEGVMRVHRALTMRLHAHHGSGIGGSR